VYKRQVMIWLITCHSRVDFKILNLLSCILLCICIFMASLGLIGNYHLPKCQATINESQECVLRAVVVDKVWEG
jgi:hypothetical protein